MTDKIIKRVDAFILEHSRYKSLGHYDGTDSQYVQVGKALREAVDVLTKIDNYDGPEDVCPSARAHHCLSKIATILYLDEVVETGEI